MEDRQAKIIDAFKRDILLHDGLGEAHVNGYEYKRFDYEELDYGTVRIGG